MILMKMASRTTQGPTTPPSATDDDEDEVDYLVATSSQKKVFSSTIKNLVCLQFSDSSADKAFIKGFVQLSSSMISQDWFWKLDEILVLCEKYPFQRPPSRHESFCSTFEEDTIELVVSYVEEYLPTGSEYKHFGNVGATVLNSPSKKKCRISSRSRANAVEVKNQEQGITVTRIRKIKIEAGRPNKKTPLQLGVGSGRQNMVTSAVVEDGGEVDREEEKEEEETIFTFTNASTPIEKKYLSDSDDSYNDPVVPPVPVQTRFGRKVSIPVRWADVTHTYVAAVEAEVGVKEETDSDIQTVSPHESVGEDDNNVASSYDFNVITADMMEIATQSPMSASVIGGGNKPNVMNMIWPMSQETVSETELDLEMQVAEKAEEKEKEDGEEVAEEEEEEMDVDSNAVEYMEPIKRGSKHTPPSIPHFPSVIYLSQDTDTGTGTEMGIETSSDTGTEDFFDLASEAAAHLLATKIEEESESIGEFDTTDSSEEGNEIHDDKEELMKSLDVGELETDSDDGSDIEFTPFQNMPWWSRPAQRGERKI